MPRGGARPGAGRKKGDKNQLTKAREAAVQQAAATVQQVLGPDASFAGDAHALLMFVYKDQSLPMDTRLDAAKAAIKFEKPALAATAVMGGDEVAAAAKDIPRDTGEDHLASLSKRYASGLTVIEGGQKKATNG